MAQEDTETNVERYETDPGETEDEEVKRNCVMGQCGMRDSDFSDGFSDDDEDESEKIGASAYGHKKCDGGDLGSTEDQIANLVKFVSIGGKIIGAKGVVVHRPTPIVPRSPTRIDQSDRNGEIHSKCEVERKRNTFVVKTNSFKDGCEAENSNSDDESDTDGSDADTESIESDVAMKTDSFDSPFDQREDLTTLDVEIKDNVATSDDDQNRYFRSADIDPEDSLEKADGDFALVGASGASVDDRWGASKQKRVLSSNTLSALNKEAGRGDDSPKRVRCLDQSLNDICAIPEITIDVEALNQIIQPLPRQYHVLDDFNLIRDDSPLMPPASDEEEDKMLSEELEERYQTMSTMLGKENYPIPLLTPPHSPRTVDDSLDDNVNPIEWPSNLVMDSAIINASNSKENYNIKLMKDLPSSESSDEASTTRLRAISIATS